MPKGRRGHGSDVRITKKLERALEAIAWEGKSEAEAAAVAEMNPGSLRNALRRSHVQGYLKALTSQKIAVGASRAVAVIDELTGEAKSEYVRIDGAKHMAALGGYRANEPAQTNVNVDVTVGEPRSYGMTVTLIPEGDDRPTPVFDGSLVYLSRDPLRRAFERQQLRLGEGPSPNSPSRPGYKVVLIRRAEEQAEEQALAALRSGPVIEHEPAGGEALPAPAAGAE